MTNEISHTAETDRDFKDWLNNEYDFVQTAWRRARVTGDLEVAAKLETLLNRDERLFVAVSDDLPLDVTADFVAPAWAEFIAR